MFHEDGDDKDKSDEDGTDSMCANDGYDGDDMKMIANSFFLTMTMTKIKSLRMYLAIGSLAHTLLTR